MRKFLLNSLFVLLALVGLALVFNKQIEHAVIRHVQPTVKVVKKPKVGHYDWQKVSSLNTYDAVAARLNQKDMSYAGLISIPAIGVNLPISLGVSDTGLSVGAGTLTPDQQMGVGNYALASHFVQGANNKDLLFSPIYYKGAVGQKIYLTDLKHIYTYTTETVKVVKPTDVQVIDPVAGKKLVTLITCDYTAERGRVIMQGELTDTIAWKDAPASLEKQFTKQFKLLNQAS